MNQALLEQKEALLCNLDSCDVCINYRIRNKMPMPILKRDHDWKPYHRYIDPSIKPSGYVRKELLSETPTTPQG
jgi:hypothetical protein